MTTGTATDKIGPGHLCRKPFLPAVCDGVLQVKLLAQHLEQSQFEVLQPIVHEPNHRCCIDQIQWDVPSS